MAKGLRVLMMGGQRVGKSSALAAMMDAFLKAPISYLLEQSPAKRIKENSLFIGI